MKTLKQFMAEQRELIEGAMSGAMTRMTARSGGLVAKNAPETDAEKVTKQMMAHKDAYEKTDRMKNPEAAAKHKEAFEAAKKALAQMKRK